MKKLKMYIVNTLFSRLRNKRYLSGWETKLMFKLYEIKELNRMEKK